MIFQENPNAKATRIALKRWREEEKGWPQPSRMPVVYDHKGKQNGLMRFRLGGGTIVNKNGSIYKNSDGTLA